MVWVRLDDRAPSHPKVLELSDAAFRLWIHGLCFCNAEGTDGRIPRRMIPRLTDADDWRTIANELTRPQVSGRVPLWVEDSDGSVVVHDYADYQPTLRDQARNREAKRLAMRVTRALDRLGVDRHRLDAEGYALLVDDLAWLRDAFEEDGQGGYRRVALAPSAQFRGGRSVTGNSLRGGSVTSNTHPTLPGDLPVTGNGRSTVTGNRGGNAPETRENSRAPSPVTGNRPPTLPVRYPPPVPEPGEEEKNAAPERARAREADLSEGSEADGYALAVEQTFLDVTRQVRSLTQDERATIAEWQAAGIELEVVLATLRDRGHRDIGSLRWFRRAVEDRQRVLGRAPTGDPEVPEPMGPTVDQRLRYLAQRVPKDLPEIRNALTELRTTETADVEAISNAVDALDERLLAEAEARASEAQRDAIEAQVDAAVATLARRIGPDAAVRHRSTMRAQILRRVLALPALQLFGPDALAPPPPLDDALAKDPSNPALDPGDLP